VDECYRYFLEDDDIDNLDVKEDEVNAKAELIESDQIPNLGGGEGEELQRESDEELDDLNDVVLPSNAPIKRLAETQVQNPNLKQMKYN